MLFKIYYFLLFINILSFIESFRHICRICHDSSYSFQQYSGNIMKRQLALQFSSKVFNDDNMDINTDFINEVEEESDQLFVLKQLYTDLCGDDNILTKENFFDWDDLKELLSSKIFDIEIIKDIFHEVNIHSNIISFNQFVELVDIVNHVADALDGDVSVTDFEKLGFGEEDDNDIENTSTIHDELKWITDEINRL